MEESIQQVLEAQRAREEEEMGQAGHHVLHEGHEVEQSLLEAEEQQQADAESLLEEVRKAAAREETARQAELIVGSIHGY
jgi:dephospho-CoA kinase